MIGLDPDTLVFRNARAFFSDMGSVGNMTVREQRALRSTKEFGEAWKVWSMIEPSPFSISF